MNRTMRALGVATLMVGLAACSGDGTPETTTDPPPASSAPAETTPAETASPATPTPTPSPTPVEPEFPTYEAGETATFAGITLTIEAVEVLKEIPAVAGSPIVADDGEQFVLVKTHFVNSGGDLVDLSCGGVADTFIQGWDDEGREMAFLFETDRIAGNPECNKQLLQGQEHAWNFAFRAVEGAVPLGLSIVDTQTYEDEIHMLFPE